MFATLQEEMTYAYNIFVLDDVLERMMDNRTAEDCKLLLGHTGPVYGTSFSHDRNYLTSSSEDGTGIGQIGSFLISILICILKGEN